MHLIIERHKLYIQFTQWAHNAAGQLEKSFSKGMDTDSLLYPLQPSYNSQDVSDILYMF